jgi:DNA-binding IclR family transcriptional regulator
VSKPREIPGAHTAQRVLRILKLVSAHNVDGITAQQIVAEAGEERSAVQRALNSLLEEGLVQRGPDQRRFHLGLEAVHLGRATIRHSPLVAKYQFALQNIARVTGDTVFLSVRLGDFILCVYRDEGSSAVRAPRTRAGDLRVMGTTAGGLALLATLPDDEVRALFERHSAAFEQARIDLATLRRHVTRARRDGYALLSDNVSEGVTSLGIVLGGKPEPFASAAIAAAKARMSTERQQALHHLLRGLEREDGSSGG